MLRLLHQSLYLFSLYLMHFFIPVPTPPHILWPFAHTFILNILNKLSTNMRRQPLWRKMPLRHRAAHRTGNHTFQSKERGGGLCRGAHSKFQWRLPFTSRRLSVCPLVDRYLSFICGEVFTPTFWFNLLRTVSNTNVYSAYASHSFFFGQNMGYFSKIVKSECNIIPGL